jgi:hypothetical protein
MKCDQLLHILFFLSGGPLIWKSQKEKRTSRSSCEAKVKATDECTRSVQWLRNVLTDLDLCPTDPTPIYNDNQAAVLWSKTSSTKGMRHYNIRENAVREALHEHNEITVLHIGGKVNPADILTKEHKSDEIFQSLRDSFMSRRSSGGCWRDCTVCTRSSTMGAMSSSVSAPKSVAKHESESFSCSQAS